MEKLKWSTQQRQVKELIPWEHNPRKLTEEQAKRLDASLEKFDLVEIPAINTDNKLIAGHQRVMRLIIAGRGEETIDVRVPNRTLTDEEFREYNLRSNKNTGEWDWDRLADFEQELLQEVGFDSKELDKIFRDETEDEFDEDAALAGISVPIAQLGDVYRLGRHRLMCGDASKAEDLGKLMGGVLADMVFTDPPYNINYSGRGKNTSNTIENYNQSEAEFRRMLGEWFASYKAATKADAPLYTCYASRTHREFEDALNQNGWEVRNQIIWVKKVASMGWGDYRWKHEPILYCHKIGTPVSFYGDRKQYTEWSEEPTDEELLKAVKKMVTKDEDGGSTVWRLGREMKYDHPTQKPIKLVSIAIRNSSKRDDIILDLFGGSGSTLIATENLSRICYTMEIDPKYVDVIVKRWEELTGQKAEKL